MIGKKTLATVSVAIIFMAGCSNEERAVTGAGKDTHGCITSAGYQWCTKTKRCERPWELAKKEKFENSMKAFDRFCKNITENKKK